MPMSLVSDGLFRVQQLKVEALGLKGRFNPIVLTDAMGSNAWKPSTAGFVEVMRQYALQGASFLYVGDNPQKDFVAPRRLGWSTLRLRRLDGEHALSEPLSPNHAADLEASSFDDVNVSALIRGELQLFKADDSHHRGWSCP